MYKYKNKSMNINYYEIKKMNFKIKLKNKLIEESLCKKIDLKKK